MSETQPGFYRGLSYEAYFAIDAVNQSTLKLFRRSPAHVREEMLHPSTPTESQELGQATHIAILEPERFEAEYVVPPKVDRRTKEGKATWKAFELENPDKSILSADDFDRCRSYAEAAWKDQTACELLKGKGLNEAVAVWEDAGTDIRCKLRIDRLTHFAGYPTVVDVKTAEDASPRGFARAIDKYDYHLQVAFYLDGLDAVAPLSRRFIFLVIEKKPPFCVACYELDVGSIELGREEYEGYLALYRDCTESGVWPGYPSGIQPISLPPWRFKRLEE